MPNTKTIGTSTAKSTIDILKIPDALTRPIVFNPFISVIVRYSRHVPYNIGMEDSVFTKIIKGELPCHKVYEDDMTIAFLPLYMTGQGHVLVVPKRQVDQFFQLEDEDYIPLMATVKKVAQRMYEVLQTERVGIQVSGLDVPHVHYHVIAFDTIGEYRNVPDESLPPDNDALAAMAKRLAF